MKGIILGLLIVCCFLPADVFSQRSTKDWYVGLNLQPLIVGTADIHVEHTLTKSISIKGNLAGRWQNKSVLISESFNKGLKEYIHDQNRGVGLAIGCKFADHYAPTYPYISVEGIMSYYKMEFKESGASIPQTMRASGLTGGATVSLGLVWRLHRNLVVDVAAQTGYVYQAPNMPRNYYMPTAGYTLNGVTEAASVKGLVFQPIVSLKYRFPAVAFSSPKETPTETISKSLSIR